MRRRSVRTRPVVLGVSTDEAASHQKFAAHYRLPFPLLVDTDAKVATAYGSWGEKVLYGKHSIGMTRSTFVIDPDGRLLKVWKRATAEGHGEGVASRWIAPRRRVCETTSEIRRRLTTRT